MFKVAYISTVDGLKEARGLLKQIYDENPKHWPAGLSPEHFDGGLYLIREASTKQAVGFCGWQERDESKCLMDRPRVNREKEAGSRFDPNWDKLFKSMGCRHTKVGYYSIGILPQFRNNGFAKAALQKLIRAKSAGVDQVKALIMASNSPSLALADSLGIEKVVKQARTALRAVNFLKGLVRPLRSPLPEGTLGKEVRDMARQGTHFFGPEKRMFNPAGHGSFDLGGTRVSRNPYALLHDILGKFKQYPSYHHDSIPTSLKGLLYDPTGVLVAEGGAKNKVLRQITAAHPNWNEDKLLEAQAFKNFIPKSRSTRDFKGTPAGRLNQVRKDIGPEFIIKPREGMGSAAGVHITEASGQEAIFNALRHSDMMVQKRIPLQELPAWQKNLDKGIAEKIPAVSNFNRGTKEMRVHVINGKVVPYGSMERGSILGNMSFMLPFRTPGMRHAESLVQQAVDQLPPKLRQNTVFGFDVGFGKGGKPFIIEANPTDRAGASGLLSHPLVMDAVSASTQGKLPLYVKGRRALAGTGLLGLGALGYQARQPEPSRLERLRSRFL